MRSPGRILRLAILNSRAHRTFTPLWRAIFGLWGLSGRTPGLRSVAAHLPIAAIHRGSVGRELKKGIFSEETIREYAGWMSRDPQGPAFLLRFHADYRLRPRPELARGLGSIRCPAAIVWGDHDIYLSTAIARELARALPAAELFLVEESGHFVTEERPGEVLAALTKLLGRPPVATAGSA